MNVKLPVNVQAAVDEYKKATGNAEGLADTHQLRAEELRGDIAAKSALLDEATDKSLLNPTPANIEKEAALQRELALLKIDLAGAEERSSRVFHRSSGQTEMLARKAIEIAKTEAVAFHNEHYDKKVSAVEDAKYAYLKALVDVHTLYTDARDIFFTAAEETNPRYVEIEAPGQINAPYLPELTPFWRQGVQVHGVSEREITRALKYGKIRKGDVAPGREIE